MNVVRLLRPVALANVGLHLAGLLVAALVLRRGCPLVPLAERRAWLETRPWGWSLGWLTWMLCALALVGFLACLAARTRHPAALLATALATAGAAVDWTQEIVLIRVLPGLQPVELFLAVERAAGLAGTVVANGFYALAVLAAAAALADRTTRVLALLTFLAGLLLALAGWLDSARLAAAATPCMVLTYCGFVLAAARAAASGPAGPGPRGAGSGSGPGR